MRLVFGFKFKVEFKHLKYHTLTFYKNKIKVKDKGPYRKYEPNIIHYFVLHNEQNEYTCHCL